MAASPLHLKILLPTQVLFSAPVAKVTVETESGFLTLLPRHIDFVTALVPGILYHYSPDGEPGFIALDEAILVKSGAQIAISTRHGIPGDRLEALQKSVVEEFQHRDDQETQARIAATNLEAHLIRGFIALD